MCGLGILPWKKKLLSDTQLADSRKIQQDDVLPWGDGMPEAQVRTAPVHLGCKLLDSNAILVF